MFIKACGQLHRLGARLIPTLSSTKDVAPRCGIDGHFDANREAAENPLMIKNGAKPIGSAPDFSA
jgi:hypothetical protein